MLYRYREIHSATPEVEIPDDVLIVNAVRYTIAEEDGERDEYVFCYLEKVE